MHSAYSTRLALYFGTLLTGFIGLLLAVWWFGLPMVGDGGAVGQRQAEVQQQMEQRADFLHRIIALQLSKRRGEVLALVRNEALAQALAATPSTETTAALQRALNQWLNGHPGDFQYVRVLRAPTGTIAASTSPTEIGSVFPDAALLQRALRPGAHELILPTISPLGKPALAWVRQIAAPGNAATPGVRAVLVAYTEIQELLDDVLLPEGGAAQAWGQTLLFDSQQRVVAAVPARDGVSDALRLDPDVSQGFEGSLLKTNAAGETVLTVYRSIPLGGSHAWTMVQLRPESEYHAETRQRLLRAVLVCVVAASLLGLVTWLTARLATRRLLDVSTAFDRLAHGERDLRLPVRAHDSLEITTIANAFNHLADAVQRSNATLEREVMERTAELQAERDRAQGYLDVAGIMLLVLDLQGRIALVNRKGAELLGYPGAQLLGMDWFLHFIPTALRDTQRTQFHAVMQGKRELEARYEHQIVDANGRSRLFAWNATVLRDRGGQPQGVLCSGQDVTVARAAQG